MKPVLLVDLSALFRAAWHANENGPMSVSVQATLDGVRRCQGLVPDALTAICCDGKGNWRKELAPSYKAQREKQPESMYGVLEGIKQRLRDDGYLLWQADGFEADDLLAGGTAKALEAGHDVVVATHDKDAAQLVSDRVRMLKTSTWEFLGPAEVVAKFGIEPEGMGDYLALVGDKSDNISGVPSVGPVTAAALLIKHGGLDGIYRKIDALQVFDKNGVRQVVTMTEDAKAIATPSIVDKLWRHKADAMLARKLVELRTDAPVDFQDIYTERRPVTKTSSKNTNFDNVDDVIAGPTAGAAPPVAAPVLPVADAASQPAATSASATSTPTAAAGAEATSGATATVPPRATAAPETALAPYVAVEYEHALEPRTMGQALTLGEVLYESRAFSRFPTAQSITAAVARGRELGIPAMASLDAFHYAADMGRLLASWQLIRALAEKDPKCKFFRWVTGDERSATWETWHKDHPEPTRITYTIEQAERAGLYPGKPKSAWNARPEEQLSKTCCCILARRVYSGAVIGLYSREEMGGHDDE